ncbi:aldehyde dehydrogenase (NADP(+)) [Pseudovibrio sp. SPO723]|uniref:aldehyde dehydrogenase (NADP(+)) n=1 Tax=Nesiotobacter zosterae TaxID=392721 RepID=UPI0029C5E54B|nr:aldehyde dehydrogenase (NADP(+)) [Pseudovibrio sp. SPO723]MDX5595382.1 aldehyde dehydrogenase (NADP(+)) [Pseudovibrio sp. SPO723]
MLSGRHLINGEAVENQERFAAMEAATGLATDRLYCEASQADVEAAVIAAEAAFPAYAATKAAQRAAFLLTIADEIEARGEAITKIAMIESALPEARLNGERGRTTGQLRFFADYIEKGECFDLRVDPALPDRAPMPRPDLRLINRPIGPVAVFGASNFPLAFSTAGGDTASALAAGCPVVVKGHPAHPGTSELVAEAILAAMESCRMPLGTFSLIQGAGHQSGAALVAHPLIKAVGFTGSLRGGRALFDIAVSRPEPIPFYGELGSVNPVFLFPEALAARGEEMANGWAASLTMGVGQFCTNPGVVVGVEGEALSTFVNVATEALGAVGPQPMLTGGIAQAYDGEVNRRAGASDVIALLPPKPSEGCAVSPAVFSVAADQWLSDESLQQEVFGPAAVVVRCKDVAEMLAVAGALEGQLTATLMVDSGDLGAARPFVPVLERKAGRLLCNGFSTGVEVSHAMMHGGRYPASTDVRSTSVGSKAIERFLRPVSYQNFPEALQPDEIRDGSGLPRLQDGSRQL